MMKKAVIWITMLGLAVSFTACGREEWRDAVGIVHDKDDEDDKDDEEEEEEDVVEEEAGDVERDQGLDYDPEAGAPPYEPEEEEAAEEESLTFVEPPATDFEYKYDAAIEGIVITKYSGKEKAIRFPVEIDGDPVKIVGGCVGSQVATIEIPDSVTEIGDSAFENSSLTKINIPDSITVLKFGAFEFCYNLTEVNIPDSVEEIGDSAFSGCSSLRNLTIPDNTVVSEYAFHNCDALTVTYQGQEYTYANDPNGW